MEIETITLERWMCRICLSKGTYNIFEERLIPPSDHQGQPSSTSHGSNGSISIIDALNCFSEFKIVKPDTVNEPVMLCQSCHAELASCVEFRQKLNDSESLLRKDCATPDLDENEEESRTGLTLQMVDIEPYLEDEEPAASLSPNIYQEEVVQSSAMHHSKPRFELTHQVSNILRHVATTSSSSSSFNSVIDTPEREKRKESFGQSDLETPKKMHRRNSQEALLEKTLIVPHYIFSSQLKNKSQETSKSSKRHQEVGSHTDRLDTDDIFHCEYCPKAFSTSQHLASHTKNVHLCQYCPRHFSSILAKNKHSREEHKSFQCSHCGFQSRYTANLKAHQRKVHSSALPVDVPRLK